MSFATGSLLSCAQDSITSGPKFNSRPRKPTSASKSGSVLAGQAVAAECKKWNRALTRDDVQKIINDYTPAHKKREIQELWIICDRTPAAGAGDYAEAYDFCQLMTALEAEQTIVDFLPLLNYLAADFDKDNVSKYFIPPSFDVADGAKNDLHTFITTWLKSEDPKPVAIWGGYGMGKTSYAKFLSAALAQKCLEDYGSRIPILLNLGDFTTAPNLETLIFSQLTNFYGVGIYHHLHFVY
jgi:hypothetical protein